MVIFNSFLMLFVCLPEAYFIDPALLAAAAETRDAVAGATGAFAAPSDPDELPGWAERDL